MSATDAGDAATNSAQDTLSHAKETLRSARNTLEQGKRAIPELKETAQRTFSDQVDRLSGQARDAASAATDQLSTARTYIIEQVQERPLSATLAALGAGFVLGLLFASRR
jgi:ElaB/YqjD/DUF883 family membrane-anchored ribosome-binding protein